MPSYSPYLTGHINKDGTSTIWILISGSSLQAKVNTGIRVKPVDWNKAKKQVRTSCRQYSQFNRVLRRMIDQLAEIHSDAAAEGYHLMPTDIKKEFEKVEIGGVPFFEFADAQIQALDDQGKFHTYKNRKAILSKFRKFIGEEIAMEQVTPQLVQKYMRHLAQIGNGQTTITANIKKLKELFTKARNIGLTDADPFRGIKLTSGKSNKTRLTQEELRAFESLQPEPGTRLADAHNLYLFSFYCAGIRFGDVCTLTPSCLSGNRLTYIMSKTGSRREIRLHEKALSIIEHYNGKLPFPIMNKEAAALVAKYDRILAEKGITGVPKTDRYIIMHGITSTNVVINRSLKSLAGMAGIDRNVSFHTARHTFADLARKKKIPIQVTSELLGHSNIAITQAYFGSGFDDDTLDQAIDSVID